MQALNQQKIKKYRTPLPIIFVHLLWLALFLLVFMYAPFTVYVFLLELVITVVFASYIIGCDFSYWLEVKDGYVHEFRLFKETRKISVQSITKVRWRKEKFWFGSGYIWGTEWRRQYYLDSPEGTMPEYPITKKLIKDLLRIRPDLTVEHG